MPKQLFEKFNGLFTNADEFSTPGSPAMENWDIDINGDLIKTKGYTRVSASTDAVSAISSASDAILTVADSSIYASTDTVIVYDVSVQGYAAVLEKKVWTVKSIPDGTSIELDSADTSSLSGGATATIDLSIRDLASFPASSGDAFSSFSNLGSREFGSSIVAMLYNGTTGYLCYTAKTQISWQYISTTVTFTAGNKTYFDTYNGKLLFVCGEKLEVPSASSNYGGVFQIPSTLDSVTLYGTSNNPTGKYIATHKERIWIGNISAIASTSEANQEASVMVSRYLPDPTADNVWTTSDNPYDDIRQDAGIFKCDSNDEDEVMQLTPGLGFLTIFRQESIYFFTGALESGSAALAKKLNVPYGAVSSNIAIANNGIFFVSQYGLSKIEGIGIKTTSTEFDNLVTITLSEPIQDDFDNVTSKANLILHLVDRFVWVHDDVGRTTYVFDTLNGNWFKHTNKLLDDVINVSQLPIGLKRWYVFTMLSGYQTFNEDSYGFLNISSQYKTKIHDQDQSNNKKDYKSVYALMQGASTDDADIIVEFETFFDGGLTAATYSDANNKFDIKTAASKTWDDITSTSTKTWATVTSSQTKTWLEIIGAQSGMLQRKFYRLGSAYQIQFNITHGDDTLSRISRFVLDYDVLDVDTDQT